MNKGFFKKYYPILRLTELLLDLFFIVLSFLIVIQLDGFVTSGDFIETIKEIFNEFFDTYIYVLTTQILYVVVVFFFFIIYQVSVLRKTYIGTMSSMIIALAVSNAVIIVFSFLLRKSLVKPEIIVFTFISQVAFFSAYKFLFHRLISRFSKKKVLMIGPMEGIKELSTKFLMEDEYRRNLKYVIFEEQITSVNELLKLIDEVDDVIIHQNLSEVYKNNIITYCLSKIYITVYLVPKLYEINIVNSEFDQVRDTPVFSSKSLHLTITQRFMKRFLDIVVSIVGLIIAFPLFLIIALIIKLHDKGPVFYIQERITRGNKPFKLIKFRTMIVDAEKETGAVWQMENDPRITKVGKFLRATRIDELPQLINVLKGEMSLIGPRPEREIFIQKFCESNPDFKYRVNVKPGITGLAQVLGKYNSTPDDKLRYDLLYIRNYSFLLDIKILFLTIKAVFDRDSSATLGIPPFDEYLKKKKLLATPIPLGLEISEKK